MTSYLFLMVALISLLVGMWLCERRSRYPELARRTYLVGTWAGILGARFWYVLQYGDPTFIGGLSSWGFMIGASAGSIAYLRQQTGRWDFGGDFSDFADAVSLSVAGGAALTRVACFFVGCNFGKTTSLPWGIRYGPNTPAFRKQLFDGILDPSSPWTRPVHPTQLYESGALLLLFLAIWWFSRASRRKLLRGEMFLGLALSYSIFRFLIEYIRDDSGGIHFGSLTFAQVTSVGVFLLAASVMVRNRVRHLRATSFEAAPAG